jgi:hypothetical protein
LVHAPRIEEKPLAGWYFENRTRGQRKNFGMEKEELRERVAAAFVSNKRELQNFKSELQISEWRKDKRRNGKKK